VSVTDPLKGEGRRKKNAFLGNEWAEKHRAGKRKILGGYHFGEGTRLGKGGAHGEDKRT